MFKNVKILEFGDYIWNYHVKCIEISTNMPGIGLDIFAKFVKQNDFMWMVKPMVVYKPLIRGLVGTLLMPDLESDLEQPVALDLDICDSFLLLYRDRVVSTLHMPQIFTLKFGL